tara:strand:- start:473 stop:922 length:450 start_codon:yes stop_codon:yes gene_type:complete
MDGTGGIQEFCNTIAGVWSNKKQAQSDPTGYVWSYIQWDLLGDSRLKSKQWYKNDGIVYRERCFNAYEEGGHVILDIHKLDWTPIGHKLKWRPIAKGEWLLNGEYVYEGMDVFYEGRLTRDNYYSWDRGFKNGKLTYGSNKAPFKFDRV